MMRKSPGKSAWIALALFASAASVASLALAACQQGKAADEPGDDACGSCAYVFVNGGIPCDYTASSKAYDMLLACACDKCQGACSGSLCSAAPSSQECGDCLEEKCAVEQASCAEN